MSHVKCSIYIHEYSNGADERHLGEAWAKSNCDHADKIWELLVIWIYFSDSEWDWQCTSLF